MIARMPPQHLLVPSEEILRQQETMPFVERSALLQKVVLAPRAQFVASTARVTTGKRAYGYVRNVQRAADKNAPLEQQCACIASFAASRNLDLLGCFGDRDTSGLALVNMPGLLRLLLLCNAGEVDAVIVQDVTRLGRSAGVILVVQMLMELNVLVLDALLGKPLTVELVTLNDLMSSSAEAEHLKLARRIRVGAARKGSAR